MIGLMDRSNPIAVGDRAHVVEDLSAFATAGDIEEAARDEQATLDALAADERAEFQALREQYATELRLQRERHSAEVVRIRAGHQAELTAVVDRHGRDIERREQERLADLTALRATLADEARAALRDDRRSQADLISDLERERERLRAKSTDSLQANSKRKQASKPWSQNWPRHGGHTAQRSAPKSKPAKY